MEFLVTYGWVFIIVLGIIGVLNYYGLFRIDRLMPDSCFISSDFSCEAFSANADEGIKLYVVNNLGYGVNVNDFRIEYVEDGVTLEDFSCSGPFTIDNSSTNKIINNNQGVTIAISKNDDCNLESTTILKGAVVIVYNIDNSDVDSTGYVGTTHHTLRGPVKLGIA